MTNIMELKDLRTKEELINYFKALGKNITDEEIESLKQSYKQAEENNSTLTMQQLDDVAGGILMVLHHVSNQEGVKEALLEQYKGQLFDTHATERFGKKPIIAQFINDGKDRLRIMHTAINERGNVCTVTHEEAEVYQGLDMTHERVFNPQFCLKNLELNPKLQRLLTTYYGAENLPKNLSIDNIRHCLLEAAKSNPEMMNWKGYERAWQPYTKCQRIMRATGIATAIGLPILGCGAFLVWLAHGLFFSGSSNNN